MWEPQFPTRVCFDCFVNGCNKPYERYLTII